MAGILQQAKQSIKYWWLFVLLGAFLTFGGIYIMFTPLESYITISIFVSILIFFNGISDIVVAVSNREIIKGWGWFLTGGILELLLGIVLMRHPQITMNILPLLVGFWLMFGAISSISTAFEIRSYKIKGWGWIMGLGVLLLLFSVLVFMNPIYGSSMIVFFTAFAIISYGMSYIVIGMKLKQIKDLAGDLKGMAKEGWDDLKKRVTDILNDDSSNSEEEIRKTIDEFKNKMKG